MRKLGDYRPGLFDDPKTRPQPDHPRDWPEPECTYCGDDADYQDHEGNFYCDDCIWNNYQEHLRDCEPSEKPEFEDYLDEIDTVKL